MWFNILKIQETITDIGIDFDLPEKVESKDKKDKCCEEAKAEYDRYRRYWVYGGSSAMDKEPEFYHLIMKKEKFMKKSLI